MNTAAVYSAPLDMILLLHFVIFGVALEAGYRIGLSAKKPLFESLLEMIPSSLFGLLALLLGFTFSMSVTRYDSRKTAVLQEANAIGTAWLRAGLLVREEDAREARHGLHAYLENRLRLPDWDAPNDEKNAFTDRNFILQRDLWRIAERSSRTDRTPLTAAFATSLNEVFDRSTDRWFHNGDHVPDVTYMVISLIAAASLFSLGALYGHRRQNRRAPLVLALLLAVVLTLIHDIDRPAKGWVRIDTSILQDLLSDFDRALPPR